MANEGNKVIEDWRVSIEFEKDNFTLITDTVGQGPMGIVIPDLHKRTYCDDNIIRYRPKDDKPLVQKDNRYFKVWIEPLPKEYQIKLKWSIIARDFSIEDTLKINVQPKFEDEITYIEVDSVDEISMEEITEIKAKKHYSKKDDNDIDPLLRMRL